MAQGTVRSYRRGARRTLISVSVLGACLLISACSTLSSVIPGVESRSDDIKPDLRETIPYDVTFDGVDSGEERLIEAFKKTSTAIDLKSRPTATKAGLERRAEDDVERFDQVLRSFGFYDGRVTFDISPNGSGDKNGATEDTNAKDRNSGNKAANPSGNGEEKSAEEKAQEPDQSLLITYHVDTGTPYLLADADLRIVHPDGSVDHRPMRDDELSEANLSIGMRAEADPILLGEQGIVSAFKNDGYPLAHAGPRKITANTSEKTLSVTYEVVTGKPAKFGNITVTGERDVNPQFIAGYRSWDRSAKYSEDSIRETQSDLAQSNLFDSVVVQPNGPVDENGTIPIEIKVKERDHRSIGGGVDYSTADGPGANAFWEHRNLFGQGEKLRLKLSASGLEQGGEATFRKPQFLRRHQALVATSEAKNYTTDAYEGKLANGFVGIERTFWDYWSTTYGVTLEYSDLTGPDSPNEAFYLGGLRGVLRRDDTDSPLDPTRGNRLEFNVSPYMSLSGAQTQFTSVSLSDSQYLALDDKGHYVIAGRGRVGTIFGDERSSIPSNKRFYSGGGGSVRGYEYQKVGPLNADGDPVGGRSVLEAGLEFRARVTDSFGIVPFVEGGNVYEGTHIGDADLYWGTGLGFRYYTAVGPVRFDFAVPLDKREGVDDDYQIYLSLGQAF